MANILITVLFIASFIISPGITANEDVDLDTKIGQMLMVGFRGLSVNDKHFIIEDIKKRHLGGVILFDYDISTKSPVRNIESPEQLKALVGTLKAASSIPLLVAIDQEGGKICRLKEKHGFPPTASAYYLGTKNDLTLTRKNAYKIAQTLSDTGINLNFAPVVDLNVNPGNPVIGGLERSFSADPNITGNHAIEFINAHHEKGVLCTIKHFPGHGSSSNDSHLGFVNVTNTWDSLELEPYKKIIQAGKADAVMTAHIFNSKLDPQYPATLSKSTITGILRDKLNYDGVIISDDMQMNAISKFYNYETAVQIAINAGVDIILIGNNLEYNESIVPDTIKTIKKLIKAGKITEERIDKSYKRILALKNKLPNEK